MIGGRERVETDWVMRVDGSCQLGLRVLKNLLWRWCLSEYAKGSLPESKNEVVSIETLCPRRQESKSSSLYDVFENM